MLSLLLLLPGLPTRCITNWTELEAGESRIVAQTPVAYWQFGSHVAGALPVLVFGVLDLHSLVAERWILSVSS